MICVDLECKECKAQEIDAMIDTKEDLPKCKKCGGDTRKLIVPVRFKLVYNNRTDSCDWAGNSSQYWKDIKEKGGEEPPNDQQRKWE